MSQLKETSPPIIFSDFLCSHNFGASETLLDCWHCRQLNIVGLSGLSGVTSQPSQHCFVSTFSGLNKPAWKTERQSWIKANQARGEKKGAVLSFVELTEITASSGDIPAHWIYNTVERADWAGLDGSAAWQCRRPPGETAWIIQKIWSPPSTFHRPPVPSTIKTHTR